MNALTGMLRKLECDPPDFLADEAEQVLGCSLEAWVRSRLLVDTVPLTRLCCLDCGEMCHSGVIKLKNQQNGEFVPYLPCPRCGAVEVPFQRLRRLRVNIPGLLEQFSTAAEIRGPRTEVLPGRCWRLGQASWAGHLREAYFVRHATQRSRPALVAALNSHPRAVLFLTVEQAICLWNGATPNPVVTLEACLQHDTAGFHFDKEVVEGRLFDAGLAEATARKRPEPKRGPRAAKIEKLKYELQQHLISARDYALETQRTTGTAKLLPRPTQKELAKGTGLNATVVSRCLKDPKAPELRLLWETAADVDKILSHSLNLRSRRKEDD